MTGTFESSEAGSASRAATAVQLITVIAPLRNEADNVDGFVVDLESQDFEGDVEVLVADGGSTDGSPERLVRAAAGRRGLAPRARQPRADRLDGAQPLHRGRPRPADRAHGLPLALPVRLPAALRHGRAGDRGVERRRGARAQRHHAHRARRGVRDGQPVRWHRVDERGLAARALRGRHAHVRRLPARTCSARVGLFDERFVRNQDDELNVRIRRAGGRVVLDPSIRVLYRPRGSLRGVSRQYYDYGRWKVPVMRKHRQVLSPRSLTPLAFVVATVLLAVAAPFSESARWLLGAELGVYVAGALVFGAAGAPPPRGAHPAAAARARDLPGVPRRLRGGDGGRVRARRGASRDGDAVPHVPRRVPRRRGRDRLPRARTGALQGLALASRIRRAPRAALAAARGAPPIRSRTRRAAGERWMLTFDDGGAGALDVAGPSPTSLAGHFFVVTSSSAAGLPPGATSRASAAMGHVIGSHSHTHPPRISACTPRRSGTSGGAAPRPRRARRCVRDRRERPRRLRLAGRHPGGRRRRGRRALHLHADRALGDVDGCLVLGRYAILHDTPAARVARPRRATGAVAGSAGVMAGPCRRQAGRGSALPAAALGDARRRERCRASTNRLTGAAGPAGP